MKNSSWPSSVTANPNCLSEFQNLIVPTIRLSFVLFVFTDVEKEKTDPERSAFLVAVGAKG
jgi:hypothetical protein